MELEAADALGFVYLLIIIIFLILLVSSISYLGLVVAEFGPMGPDGFTPIP